MLDVKFVPHGDARSPQIVIECLTHHLYSSAQPEHIAIFSSYTCATTGVRSLILPRDVGFIYLLSSHRYILYFQYIPSDHTSF